MIRRTPKGQFCDPGCALWEWLPDLLRQACRWQWINTALRRMAQQCVAEAGDEYRLAANCYQGIEVSERESAHRGTARHEEAQKWLRKRDLLLKCLKDIEEL